MIVTCEQCSTQFQLDDAKVPERGVRVRCSRCKHAFFVKRQTEAGEGVERAVEHALDSTPETDTGLQRGAGLLDEGHEESDWEFNHEPGGAERGAEDSGERARSSQQARAALDDLLAAPGSELSEPDSHLDSGTGDDVDSLLGGGEEDDSEGDSSASGLELDDDRGSGQLSAPDDDPFDRSASIGPADDEPLSEEGGVGDLLADVEAEPAPPRAPAPVQATPAQPRAAAPAQGDLDTPENWDFFDDEGDAPAPAARTARLAIGRIGMRIGGSVARPPVDVNAEPSWAAVWLERAVHAVGWAAVVVLGLAGLYGALGFGGAQAPAASDARSFEVAGLEVSDLHGGWIDNAAAGPIFVVSGEVHNAKTQFVTPGARLAVRLLDAQGRVVAGDAGALGVALPTERLRTERPQTLRSALAAESRARAWAPIPPGGSQIFQAVLASLPDAAARIEVVAVPAEPDGRPAPQPMEPSEAPAAGPS